MSGGSLGYLGFHMGQGEIDVFRHHAAALCEYLDLVRAELVAGTLEGRAPHPTYKDSSIAVPYQPRLEAVMAIDEYKNAIAKVVSDTDAIQATLAGLAEVATVADRAGSGDDGRDDLADAVVAWRRRRCGLEPLPNWRDRPAPGAP